MLDCDLDIALDLDILSDHNINSDEMTNVLSFRPIMLDQI